MTDNVVPLTPLLRELLDLYPSVSPAERKVADEILARPREVVHLTAEELARLALVSQPVTSRLCRRLSTRTFSAFKIRLAQQLGDSPEQADDATPDGRIGVKLASDYDLAIGDPQLAELVSETRDELAIALRAVATIDPAALHAAAEALATAETIILCGFDVSGSVAWRLASLLRMEGLRARPEYDYQNTPSVSDLGPRDVLLAISFRGSMPQLKRAVAEARDRGVTLILLTNEAKFDIGAKPQILLLTHAPSATTEEKYVTGSAVYVQLAVARTLWRVTRSIIRQKRT